MKIVGPKALETEKVKLLQEGAIMGQFQHSNVVRLHGVVTVGEPVSKVTELFETIDFCVTDLVGQIYIYCMIKLMTFIVIRSVHIHNDLKI